MAAAETARLIASLELQDKNFTRGIKQVERGVDRVDRKLGAFSGALNRNLGRLVDTALSRGVDALSGTIEQASNLNEEITKSDAVFGSSAKSIQAWADTTASSLGIAEVDALAAAGAFGNMFRTTGFAGDEAANMSKRMVELAADMASFNNEDPNEMLDKLRSGLSGEAEPLRRFGVLLSEAAVKEEAYASGIAKRGKKLTESQKVQARYNLILKQTALQQGDVEKTGGNLAGQQRKLNALLKDASATIGTALLPVVTDLTSEFVKLFQDPDTQAGIKAFSKDLGQGAKDLVKSLKTVDWKGFASALGTAAGFAADLVKAFLGLPSWLQAAVVTGWGLNKVTGGLIGDLASGLIKGVLGINAGVVNVNGPVSGMGAAGAAAGASKVGRFANAVKILGAVSIAGASIVALAQAFQDFQTTVTESQTALQEKVNATNKQNFSETIANLQATNKNLQRMNGFEEIIASGFGGGQITENFEMAANRIVEAQGLTRSQTIGALNALKDSQQQARELLLKTPKLDAAILTLERRLAGKTPAGTSMGGAPGAFRPTPAQKEQTAKIQSVQNAVKNAQSIASRENSAQKAEIARTKQAAATAGRTTTQASRNAGIQVAAATRNVAPPISAAVYSIGRTISATIWAARPVIQSTNVVNNYTTQQRTGASSGSRNSGPLR